MKLREEALLDNVAVKDLLSKKIVTPVATLHPVAHMRTRFAVSRSEGSSCRCARPPEAELCVWQSGTLDVE